MNYRAVYDIAIVLTKTQLRGSQRSKLIARLFGNPRIILAADLLLLAGLGGLGYFVTSRIPGQLRNLIAASEGQALAGIPTAIAFAVIVFGILYELSQPTQLLGTDLMNWLPVSPTEYVAGSTLSECYLYSIMQCIFLGVLLGPAFYLGVGTAWAVAAIMSTISLFMGACVIELIDAITNRISSTFYKRSGRSAIVFRLAITVFFLVFVQLLFSGQIAIFLVQSLIRTVEIGWFVPVIWPSVTVLSIFQGSPANAAIFGGLSIVFSVVLFGFAVTLRQRFWVPVPVSIKFSSKPFAPSGLSFRFPGIGGAESAILLKDFRSLVRRREMARFLAIPFVLAVSMSLPMFPRSGEQAPEIITELLVYVIPLVIFSQLLAMTSIGQEGRAIWNLYAAPLRPESILRAKFLLATILGSAFCIAMTVILGIIFRLTEDLPFLLIIGIGVVLEQASIGMFVGCRFPDFREAVRSRYVSVWGSLIGMGVGLVIAFVSAAPLLLQPVLDISLAYGSAFSFTLAIIVTAVALKASQIQMRKLLRNITN